MEEKSLDHNAISIVDVKRCKEKMDLDIQLAVEDFCRKTGNVFSVEDIICRRLSTFGNLDTRYIISTKVALAEGRIKEGDKGELQTAENDK